jgi:hypothetical protein
MSVVDLLVDECPVNLREQQNNDQSVHKSKCVEITNEQEKVVSIFKIFVVSIWREARRATLLRDF